VPRRGKFVSRRRPRTLPLSVQRKGLEVDSLSWPSVATVSRTSAYTQTSKINLRGFGMAYQPKDIVADLNDWAAQRESTAAGAAADIVQLWRDALVDELERMADHYGARGADVSVLRLAISLVRGEP